MKTITENYILNNNIIPVNEQLDIILCWLNEHNQYIVDKIKSISDVMKLYEYCKKADIVYFDNIDDSVYYTTVETEKFKKEITKLLGYSIYN